MGEILIFQVDVTSLKLVEAKGLLIDIENGALE